MTAPAVDREVLEFAVGLAHRAGQAAAGRFFAADFFTGRKADGTEVTDADLVVEELIRSELLRRCPGDEIYGEEAGTVAGWSGRRWIIDPIDGTAYFAHRIPLFSTMLAYEDEHGPGRPSGTRSQTGRFSPGAAWAAGYAPERRRTSRQSCGVAAACAARGSSWSTPAPGMATCSWRCTRTWPSPGISVAWPAC